MPPKGKKNQSGSGKIADAPLPDLRIPQITEEIHKEAEEEPEEEDMVTS